MIYSSIGCCEVDGTRKETRTATGDLDVTVDLNCAYADRYLLCSDLFGSGRPYPYDTGALCISAEVAVWGDGATSSQSIDYSTATVTAKYSNKVNKKAQTNAGGQLYADTIEPSVEFITLDHTRFKWNSASGDVLKESEAPGRQMYSIAFTRTLYKVASGVPAYCLDYIGKCNASYFYSSMLGLTFPAETLLFMPTVSNRSVTTDGSPGWDVVLKWSYKPETWNKFWRSKTQAYEAIYMGSSLYKNFPTIDMSAALF